MDSGSGNQICSDDEDWSTLPKGDVTKPEPEDECKTIKVNGQDCDLIYLGKWKVSKYYYPTDIETAPYKSSTYSKTDEMTTINVKYLSEPINVPFRFVYGSNGMAMQGTVIHSIYGPINGGSWNGYWVYTAEGYYDYYEGTGTFALGWGGPGYEMEPYRYAAVGSSYLGGTYYMPDLKTSMKDESYGIVYGYDRGGNINNTKLDLFVGIGYDSVIDAWENYSIGGTNDWDVYEVNCPPPPKENY